MEHGQLDEEEVLRVLGVSAETAFKGMLRDKLLGFCPSSGTTSLVSQTLHTA